MLTTRFFVPVLIELSLHVGRLVVQRRKVHVAPKVEKKKSIYTDYVKVLGIVCGALK